MTLWYSEWAEICSEVTARFTFWETVVSLVISVPIVIFG